MPHRVPTYRPSHVPPPDRHREYNRSGRDPTLRTLYATARWRHFRETILAERPLCQRCLADGLTVVGDQVHHKVDPRDNPDLTLDADNVEVLCRSCHSRHHASRDRPR